MTSPLGAELLVAVAVCLLLALFDVIVAATRTARLPMVGVFGAAFSLALLAVVPVVAAMGPARRWAGRMPARRVLVGISEALGFAVPVFIIETHESLAKSFLLSLAGGFILAKIVFSFVPRSHLPRVLIKVAFLLLCVAALLWLPWRQKPVLRVALNVTIALVAVSVAGRAFERMPARWSFASLGVALVLSIAGFARFRQSPSVQAKVIDVTTQARAGFSILSNFCPRCIRVRETKLGPKECPAKPKGCIARELSAPSSFRGKAQGADILLLSIDSLRADYIDLLEPVLAVLGEPIQFTQAISPAPGTRLSFGSMFRGRPARRVPFSQEVLLGGVPKDSPPTLATLIAAQGYRAVQIPTHRFFNPAVGLTTGFEQSNADAQPPLDEKQQAMERVPYRVALRHALDVARDTTVPLLLWTHAMETHYPYGGEENRQPQTREGHRAAVALLAQEVAAFVPEFRKLREPRPLVVVIFGDHGEEFGEHGGRYHSTTVYQEVIHVVLMLSGPGVGSRTITHPVSLSALPATLFDWLGLPIPCSFDIPSLLPCVEDSRNCPSIVASSLPKKGGMFAYTGTKYRLLLRQGQNLISIFDAAADPLDQNDLRGSRALDPTDVRELTRGIAKFDSLYCVSTEANTGGD